MTDIPQEEHPTDDDPRERLRAWVHAVDMRVAMGKIEMPGATVSLGIMLQTKDPPGGRVTAQFDADPFLKDIRDLVDTDNLWTPGPEPLFLYLVKFDTSRTYGAADRVLFAAHDEDEARELAGDDDVTITSVRCIGKANVPDLDDSEAQLVEVGSLMCEHDSAT